MVLEDEKTKVHLPGMWRISVIDDVEKLKM